MKQVVSDKSKKLSKTENVDIGQALVTLHATGGNYMSDMNCNLETALAECSDCIFVLADKHKLAVVNADDLYRIDTHDTADWMMDTDTSETNIYLIVVAGREDGVVMGDICEIELEAVQESLRRYGFHFTHITAEMKDGTTKDISFYEWDIMESIDRDQIKSYVKHYDPKDITLLNTLTDALSDLIPQARENVSVNGLFSKLTDGYMDQSQNPQPDMIRLNTQAAREILAQNTADVYRLSADDAKILSPIEAAKTSLWYSSDKEFAIKKQDLPALEKWAERTAVDISRQLERQAGRDEHKKSRKNLDL